MDSCWSYEYYTKQVFKNKATAADPTGWALADVVNNTEEGITGTPGVAAAFYVALFDGAAAVHDHGDATRYSWNNLVRFMNAKAEEYAAQRREADPKTDFPDPQIYGASGVRTNQFHP
jgi:hypothetical protein